MAKRRKVAYIAPFDSDKYYHVHNDGIDRRILFSSKQDFDRFEAYLYLLNSTESPRAANFFTGNRQNEIFQTGRGDKLIALGAYSITPHEFHLLAVPLVDGGMGKFMQKLQTGYTMYFNSKYQRMGRIFQSSYKAESARSAEHLKYMFCYIHLNPAQIFDKEWDSTNERSGLATHILRAMNYRYSSANEYTSQKFIITTPHEFPPYIRRVRDARAYLKLWSKFKE
ncbi:MAG: transposase [Parcubacteria group bacterium Gr01-1014_8]|nr:MAG: transposase [Parcubacteria group bacterium Gr01-1014_8]